ncbi:unnamed protein product [Rhizophagus irregularis]|nr:unnamed protein product [Rhizophagus irregularis]
MDTDILGNRLQHGCRYSRKSAPTWMPIFQEISSNVDADIPGISVPAWIPNPKDKNSVPAWIPNPKGKDISSDLDTESHWLGNGSDLDTESHWESVLPFLQEIGSGVDTDIPGKVSKFLKLSLKKKRFYTKKTFFYYTLVKKIGSGVDTDIPGFLWIFIGLGEDYGWMIDGRW